MKLLSIVLTILYCSSTYSKDIVLVGGGLNDGNAGIWNKVIELAGGSGNARIGVVTAASADPEDSADYYDEMFHSYGATEVYWIPVHEGNTGANSDPEVVANIRRMTGFFFGGGDQRRIITSFYNAGRVESPALGAMRETYDAGAMMGGSSAGAACMGSTVMITGGLSWDALRYGAYEEGSEIGIDDLTYDRAGGIGMFDNAIIDTHFSERGREGRLIRLMADTRSQPHGSLFGIGVDEDTALVVYNVGQGSAYGEVIGEEGVYFADISRANIDSGAQYWDIDTVDTHYLTEGDQININSWAVTFASWKSDMRGQEEHDNAVTSEKIFNGNRDNPNLLPEYTYVATELLDSRLDTTTWGRTEDTGPRFRVWFEEGQRTRGFGGRNPRTDRFDIVYEDLIVDMESN